MVEETSNVEETSESSTPDGSTGATPVVDLDQKIRVGGEEYSAKQLAETAENYENLREYAEQLEGFRDATSRLMNPETSPEVKKQDARALLTEMNYAPEQINEWVKIYDEETPMAENPGQTPAPPQPVMDPRTDQINDQMLKMRAQMLQQNLENSLTSAIESDADSKMLIEWLGNNRQAEEAKVAKESISERVKAQALENLRSRRNQAGSFDDNWVGEEVQRAASKVAKDMLTVIGDTSKIGRVPETAGQTEVLHRKEPVKVPDTKGKSFGDVEAQLRDWTSDQILRSLSDPGGDSKA